MELLKTILGKMSITKTQKMIGDFSSFLLEKFRLPLTRYQKLMKINTFCCH